MDFIQNVGEKETLSENTYSKDVSKALPIQPPIADAKESQIKSKVESSQKKYKEFSKEELEKIYNHYNRKEILNEMVRCSINKEVVGSFGGVGYAKRPNIIEYQQDILAEVKRGITSFHASEELWSNPLNISTELKKGETDALRVGWDLILDIDCKELEYSKIAADFIIRALSFNGIKSISCKFSGNHGFHIAVPWEAFPKSINGKETRLLFPEAPRAIAEYLKLLVERRVGQALFNYEREKRSSTPYLELINGMIKTCEIAEGNAQKIIKSVTHQKSSDGLELVEFDAFHLVGIDTILINSRHLYRQVYSVNEKSGLISIPINPLKVLFFDKNLARIENNIVSRFKFLERENVQSDEATRLLTDSYDYVSKKKRDDETTQFLADQEKKESVAKYAEIVEKIPEEFFPPQIKKLLEPMQDGKKRAMFILISFLKSCGYNQNEIEVRLTEWNNSHREPLRDTFFKTQIKQASASVEKILPPNYKNKDQDYDPNNMSTSKYTELTGIPITPREFKFRNPVTFARAGYENWIRENKDKTKKTKNNTGSDKKEKVSKKKMADISTI